MLVAAAAVSVLAATAAAAAAVVTAVLQRAGVAGVLRHQRSTPEPPVPAWWPAVGSLPSRPDPQALDATDVTEGEDPRGRWGWVRVMGYVDPEL